MASKQSTRVKVPYDKWILVGSDDKDRVIENVSSITNMFLLGSEPVNAVRGHTLSGIDSPLSERKETIPAGTMLWCKSAVSGKSTYLIVTE